MNKYFIILATAALAVSAACTKVVTDEAPAKKISFEVASYVATLTKAENTTFPGTGGSLFNEFASPKFYTYAYFYPENGTQGQTFMNNVEIVPNGATSAATTEWAPAVEYFWPKTGYVNFFSYASKNAVTPTVTNLESSKQISFSKTIVADDNILLADACYNAKASNSSTSTMNVTGETTVGVPTLFRHLLCQVKFQFKLASSKAHPNTTYEVVLSSASIDNIANTGTLSLTNAGTTGTALTTVDWGTSGTVGWTPSSGDEDITFTVSSSAVTLATSATAVAHESSVVSLLDFRSFLPQTLSDDVVLNLVYTVRAKHGSTTYSEENITVSGLKLNTGTLGVWNMNERITYTIIIDPVTTIVTFDPAVVAWDESKSGSITI